jgi:hypothetical protein
MNEIQNGHGFLNMWPIQMKLRQNASELFNDEDKLLDLLEKMSNETEISLTGVPCEVCEHCSALAVLKLKSMNSS